MKKSAPPKDIDEYLAGVNEPARGTLRKIRAAIRAAAPEATETISYQMPAFKYQGRSLIWFAAFSKHCSVFPGSKAVIDKFKDDLKGLHTSKGTIQFPMDKPLSATLVKKIVKARLAENERMQRQATSKKS